MNCQEARPDPKTLFVKMAKKSKKIRLNIPFVIEKAFPSSDSISLYLLLLQGAYNDLQFIGEWVDSHSRNLTDKSATIFAGGRWSLQLRFWAAIVYEILKVLDKAAKDEQFMRLSTKMSTDARDALTRLLNVRLGPDRTLKKFLHRTRNRAAYHYDRDAFESAINKLLDRYGRDSKSHIIVTEGGADKKFHFLLPDKIRTEIAVGLRGAGSGDKEIQALIDLSADFRTFLFGFFNAYAEERNLDIHFEQTAS